MSELPAGESLVQRGGWDTLAFHDMPPPPGAYTVDATFLFMSRGEPPAPEAGTDQFSVVVTVPLVVEGPEVDYVSPGEPVDALLSDDGFRALLADAPRPVGPVESHLPRRPMGAGAAPELLQGRG